MATPAGPSMRPHCCPSGVTRREFLRVGGAAVGALALAGLAWESLRAEEIQYGPAPRRKPLVVKPILAHEIPGRGNQTSWRNWGGVHTQEAANEEATRIQGELDKIKAAADFPVTFLPVDKVRGGGDIAKIQDLTDADTIIVYAAGAGGDVMDAARKSGKSVIAFLRHKSGPVYLWYEIMSPRYLRQHSDVLAMKDFTYDDVVTDSLDELALRLRALGGLKNTIGTRIITIGGASGWCCGQAPQLAKDRFKLDIQDVPYADLGKLIQAARQDASAVKSAKERAAAYLKEDGLKLETKPEFVENAFLLEQVFRGIMNKAGARAMTINSCMGTIMPMAETTACLALSLLNDAGYQAYCESDFVVIPSGILLTQISGRPNFLNDPTYPHQGVITLAHCTAPRKMDGKKAEAARIMTHFESDYGASPKVEMVKGTKVTSIIPDFLAKKWTGFVGEIVDVPFLQICRSQIDVAYKATDQKIAENMPGFHWMTVYGDYSREVAYALRKTTIAWENLT